MNSSRKIFTFILLQAFLAFGGIFGSKACCIEEDGDVFSVNLLTGADEADNDHYEADWLRPLDHSISAVQSSESENYIIVLVAEDSHLTTAKLDFPAKLYLVLTIPAFTLIGQAVHDPAFEVRVNDRLLPSLRIALIRTIVINC